MVRKTEIPPVILSYWRSNKLLFIIIFLCYVTLYMSYTKLFAISKLYLRYSYTLFYILFRFIRRFINVKIKHTLVFQIYLGLPFQKDSKNRKLLTQHQTKYLKYISTLFPLKLVSAIFYQFFKIFSSNDSPSKTMKHVFLFHLGSSFRSLDIQIFVFFPFLSTLFRLKRANGSGIMYDVMNWLA